MTGADWRLIREEPRSGPMQMALDEVAADTASAGGPRTVRVYRWRPSTLSLGYRQGIDTVDLEYCRRHGIDLTRRPTGGGGIYHDETGDISYSIALPADETAGDLTESYRALLEPVFDAFNRMGVPVTLADAPAPAIHEPCCYLRALDPAHDLVVGERKISGNAQYRRREAVIQHGSLTWARRTDRHLSVFAEPDLEADAFEERVTSIRAEAAIDREAAVEAIETALGEWAGAEPGEWTDDELASAREKVEEKFGAESWTTRH